MSQFRAATIIETLPAEKVALIATIELLRVREYDYAQRAAKFTKLAVNIGASMEREIFASLLSSKSGLLQKASRVNEDVDQLQRIGASVFEAKVAEHDDAECI